MRRLIWSNRILHNRWAERQVSCYHDTASRRAITGKTALMKHFECRTNDDVKFDTNSDTYRSHREPNLALRRACRRPSVYLQLPARGRLWR